MIVLDEQLLGRGIEASVRRWYPGRVQFVTELRLGMVIKDEAIPMLLSQQDKPTFVTINETDFRQRVAINDKFCVVCLSLPDARATEGPELLRKLLHHAGFRTKEQRKGKVVRITKTSASFYTAEDRQPRALDWE